MAPTGWLVPGERPRADEVVDTEALPLLLTLSSEVQGCPTTRKPGSARQELLRLASSVSSPTPAPS
jgi:hypothetical protein